jgi:hypothetical protein
MEAVTRAGSRKLTLDDEQRRLGKTLPTKKENSHDLSADCSGIFLPGIVVLLG